MSRSKITAALRRLLGLTTTAPVRTPVRARNVNRFRPGMEALEDRTTPTPAVMTWLGYSQVDMEFSNPDNWLQDGIAASRAPQAGDDLIFSGFQTQTDCVGLVGPSSGAYASITIEAFTAIYLGGDVTTEALTLADGDIRNTANGQDITVTETFEWTAGRINPDVYPGPYTGTLHLVGATTNIDPGAGNTITTGSTISFEASSSVGSTGWIYAGTLSFLNDATLLIGSACTLNMPESSTGAETFLDDIIIDDDYVLINSGGTWNIDNKLTSSKPLYNYFGTFNLGYGKTASFGGMIYETILGVPTPLSSFYSIGADVNLSGGSILTVENGMFLVNNSALTAAMNTQQPLKDVVRIQGALSAIGSTVKFSIATPAGTRATPFGMFEVTGDVYFKDVTYKPIIDRATAGASTSFVTLKALTIAGSTSVSPVVQFTPPAGGDVGFEYSVLKASTSITGTPTNSVPLAYDLNSVGTPVKEFRLKRK